MTLASRSADSTLNVPSNPVIPFIEGDGTGVDIWASSVRVIDAAVAKAYGGTRKIEWLEVCLGGNECSALPDTFNRPT